jgi:WD40 repeat protein
MPQSARIFRVFVSSTFSDMVTERNALQECVFPRLRELCFLRGARLQAIDLRWGISQEAGLNQRAVYLCLNEIKRCQEVTRRPNFLLLLGDRYGWCPLPDNIPADEFAVLIERMIPADQTLVRQWYWRDDNAVPAVYILQPRRDEYVDKDRWNAVEVHLRRIILEALNGLDWTYEKRLKYEASVTEQEIAAGIFDNPDATKSAYCFFRTIDGLPTSATEFSDADQQAKRQLADLKQRLVEHLPNNIYAYRAQWTGNDITSDHLDQLCEDVYNTLSQAIMAEVATFQTISWLEAECTTHEAFMAERTRHFVGRTDALAYVTAYLNDNLESVASLPEIKTSRLPRLFKRTNGIDTAHTPVQSMQDSPLVLYGQSGVGKSTVMARAIQQAQAAWPQAEIVYRFIGVTPASSDIRTLLISLCQDIGARYGTAERIPQSYNNLIKALPGYLGLATPDHPLILFLDALDQLQNSRTPNDLHWLPEQLPAEVKLVMSSIPGEYVNRLAQRLPKTALFEIRPVQQAFAAPLLDEWLREAGRSLQPAQRAEVLEKFSANGLPLYLRLAFEETRRWYSYTAKVTLKPDVLSLLRDNLFARLAGKAEHGEMLVSRSLGYLVASRNGLSEDEILDVLAQDDEFWSAFLANAFHTPPRRQLPVAVWSRLYSDLEPYLTDRGADGTALMVFYHRQFVEAVQNSYVAGHTGQDRHVSLASYFKEQPTFTEKAGQPVYNLRKLSELPYQQTLGGQFAEVKATLTDLMFVAAKVAAHSTFTVEEDYERALAARADPLLDLLNRQIGNCAHLLGKTATLRETAVTLCSRLYHLNELRPLCERLLDELKPPYLRMGQRLPDVSHPALIRTLTGHTDAVIGCAMSADGKTIISISKDGTLKVWDGRTGQERFTLLHIGGVLGCAMSADGNTIVSASKDGTLKVWDARTRQERFAAIQTGGVTGCAMSVDGKTIVSSSRSGVLKVWDGRTGQERFALAAYTAKQLSKLPRGVPTEMLWCAVSADGRTIVSAPGGGILKVWDRHTRREGFTILGHMGWVTGCALSPDGRTLITASSDETLKVWNESTRHARLTLVGHSGKVTGCAMTADEQTIVSASEDSTLKVWDARTGQVRATLTGHMGAVNACAMSADGNTIVSASEDGTLRVWNGQVDSMDGQTIAAAPDDKTLKVLDVWRGQEPLTLTGHGIDVRGCALSADGRTLASVSEDGTLKIWDGRTGVQRLSLRGHRGWVTGCAVSADGKTVVSASKDGTLRQWDGHTGQDYAPLTGHRGPVNGCAVSADGQTIVSASDDETLKVWDTHFGERLIRGNQERFTLKGHRGPVIGCAMSADGQTIVSASGDTTLMVWDRHTGKRRRTLTGHTDIVSGCAVSADGQTIVSASHDKTLKVWDGRTGKERFTLTGHDGRVTGCAMSADARIIISASLDGMFKVWDGYTGKECFTLYTRAWLGGCAISADGQTIVCASADMTLRVWDGHAGQEPQPFIGHTDAVVDCAISADGQTMVSVCSSGALKVWDGRTGQIRVTLTGHREPVTDCAISADGQTIVSASHDKTLKVWDGRQATDRRYRRSYLTLTGLNDREYLTLTGHTGGVTHCAMSADGQAIVSASDDKTLKVWDGRTGQERFTLTGHAGEVRGCALSADGQTIVSASDDKTLKVWDGRTGQERFTLTGHTGEVRGCALSADGQTIVSISDETLKVWDAAGRGCLTTLLVEATLYCCAIDHDGRHILSGGAWGLYFLELVR